MKKQMSLIVAVVVFILYVVVSSQYADICSGRTCSECIAQDYSCAWCKQKNFSSSRCQHETRLENAGCDPQFIEKTITTQSFIKNEPVRDSNSTNRDAIQIQPQKVALTTRIREDRVIQLVFRAANNFPVDLYFLFDNSLSMEKQIQTLGTLANNIGLSIRNISSNFTMGYGVFQDKVILPFTDTSPLKLQNPCVGTSRGQCAPPFEFKHLLTMTNDIKLFTNAVQSTSLTGNLDHPEGSTDAILQAVACQQEIGWRNKSRKLLIFASNDRFHLAGDGRLAGIVLPNDGHCHLDSQKRYSKELEQDYPSVSQLSHIVNKNDVHIIFAVTEAQEKLFKSFSERIPDSIVEILHESGGPTSQNIKDIIEKKYKEMLSEVEIMHTSVEGIDVQVRATSPKCDLSENLNKCKGIKIGDEITFEVHIKATQCPKVKGQKKFIEFNPKSLKSDKMILEIDIICDCPCDSDNSTWEYNSKDCSNGNGTLKCGMCECHKDYFGAFCECDQKGLILENSPCIKPGDNSSLECSGQGKCECKVCKCNDDYSGTYCDCYDKGCELYNKEICGGPSRGKCVCGQCLCQPEFSGSNCGCSNSNQTCMLNNKMCSDAGDCVCGGCDCKKGYTGLFCENCFLCGDTVCDNHLYRACAECNFKQNQCPSGCPDVQLVDSIKDYEGSVCSVKQDDGCFMAFHVQSSENNVTIILQKTTTCPEPVDILPIAIGVVGGVVAIGLLLLLLWKILTTIFDRVEYSKFQEDLKQCKWAQQDNPFYKGATTTYKNPMLDTSQPL
ncbi:integrin beta-1-like [Physella acuta]|uniref:integrin beta-1-like n=1 Tax=Physella acuta TaxID=109671 RepID=UPI0027DCDBFF|nr:integrin beta-1-like [Physella acuta]